MNAMKLEEIANMLKQVLKEPDENGPLFNLIGDLI